jgi:rubrerythrin
MTTVVGAQHDLHALLENLIELGFDASEAYDAAIERVDDAGYRARLAEFRSDHFRHTEELSRALRERGHDPPNGPISSVFSHWARWSSPGF